jgi:8-amino-7-oxononanoate synthase
VVVVKAGDLPVTTSGKLKRRACAERYARGELTVLDRLVEEKPDARPSESSAAPEHADKVNRLLAIVARHTKAPISTDAKLSDLGLDSVKATELTVEISDAFGVDLPPSVLSPDSTLAQLAAFVSGDANERAACGISGSAQAAARPSPLVRDKPPLEERLQTHAAQLGALRSAGVLNFNLVQSEKLSPTDARMEGDDVSFFSSYSYLGLNQHPAITRAKMDAVSRHGSGSHGVMMLGGYTAEHRLLEEQLAKTLSTDDAILYSSGYMANLAAIDTLVDRNGAIYCDMLVHTSILDGCRLSGADVKMFPHQDAEALGRMLARRPKGQAALVIIDGVYSLRGEIANLPAILSAAHEHGAIVMMDEAHALGSVGYHGRGTAEHHGVEGLVDLYTGGLGKGIPAYGGFVAGRAEIINYLRYRSNPYVYSGGMDVANVAAARRALSLMREDPSIMQRLRENIALMEALLERKGIPSLRWGSPCMPVVCRDDREAYALSRELRRRGFYVAPIVYPAVPKDQQGLRLTVTAAHSHDQIKRCIDELESALETLRTPRKAQTTTHSEGPRPMTNQEQTLEENTYTAIPQALEAFARGEFLLVSDDEDRENEGDLIIAAEYASPSAINFMITHGKGLVCLAISPEIATQKRLAPMVVKNQDPKGTAFTVSVDAAPCYGITTGISAAERARTVQVLISEEFGPEALRAPGHMFPLVAKQGGLDVRQGHTEAGVDLARLAGLSTAASVIVEVIKEDGEMARRDDLVAFSKQHNVPYITIAQLRAYMAAQKSVQPKQAAEAELSQPSL